jgi:hypothetical protein
MQLAAANNISVAENQLMSKAMAIEMARRSS